MSMDARQLSLRLLILTASLSSIAASHRTRNFVVTAPTPEIARQVGEAAEVYRRELAVEWLGHELPAWYAPCPIKVKVGQLGAGGATTFNFAPDQKGVVQVYGWDMQIQGSLERILDSVLPHEVSHTIFACHFRRPLPRWADEGAATLAEADCEKKRQVLTVKQVLNTQRRIPLKKLVEIQEYPKDMQDVLTLYAEGYSVAELLVQQGGKSRYLKFLHDAHQKGWDGAVTANYGYRGVEDLEKRWTEWVVAGSPTIDSSPETLLVDAAKPASTRQAAAPVIRGQSPSENSQDDPFLKADAVGNHVAAVTRGNRLEAPEPSPRARRVPNVESSGSTIAFAADHRDEMLSHVTPNDEPRRPNEQPVLRRTVENVNESRTGRQTTQNSALVGAFSSESSARSQPLLRTGMSNPTNLRNVAATSNQPESQETPWSEFPVEPRRTPAFQFGTLPR